MATINWETYKEKGNEEFKKKNYDSAISHYTDGISILILIKLVTLHRRYYTQTELNVTFFKKDIN